MKSLRVAWYKKPILQDAFFTDIQTGSMITAIFSMVGNNFPSILNQPSSNWYFYFLLGD